MNPPDAREDGKATPVPCITCDACCRNYVVPVSGEDIWKLSTRQRLDPSQFVVVVPEKAPRPDAFRLAEGGPLHTLALDKKGPFSIKRPCVFLIELPGSAARCGVYDDRPIVCSTYPMSMWSGVVALRRDVLCPPGGWPAGSALQPKWRTAMQRLVFQMDIYGEVVARWNARVAARPGVSFVLPEYLSYVINVYSQLNELQEAIGPEGVKGVVGTWPTFPRPALDAETVAEFAPRVPWLRYFALARGVIDEFYPYVSPLPPALRANADATAAEQPVDLVTAGLPTTAP